LKLRVPGWLGNSVFASDLYTYTSPVSESIGVGKFDAMGGARPGQGWTDVSIPITAAAASQHAAVPVHLNLPMPVRRSVPNPGRKEDAGKAAIQRGPIVYALEAVDNGGKVLDVPVPATAPFTPQFKSDLLGGVTVLTATMPAAGDTPARTITAVPYFAWANR